MEVESLGRALNHGCIGEGRGRGNRKTCILSCKTKKKRKPSSHTTHHTTHVGRYNLGKTAEPWKLEQAHGSLLINCNNLF